MTAVIAEAAPAGSAGTNDTAGARRIAAAFAAAAAARPRGPHPVRRRRLSRRRDRASRPPSPRSTPAPTSSSSACRTRTPSPTAPRSRRRRRSRCGTARRSMAASRLIERIASARPADPRSCRWATRTSSSAAATAREAARRLASAGAAGVIVADLTPDEGGPFEAVARDARPRGRLPRRADDAARPPGRDRPKRSGGFLYCVSLVGVTGARDALPTVGRALVRDVVAASPVPVGVGFGVSRPAHVRAIAKAGAGGRDRRVGARRRARRRRPRRGSRWRGSSATLAAATGRRA